MIEFSCEKCGYPFHHVEPQFAGKLGRCKHCGHVMQIPSPTSIPSAGQFHLKPLEPEPEPGSAPAVEAAHRPVHHEPIEEPHIELVPLVPEDDPARKQHHAPEVEQALREEALLEEDSRPYQINGEYIPPPGFRRESRPAGWVVRAWRGSVGGLLKILRWVNDSAYLISIPFVALLLFGFVAEKMWLFHLGAVGIVLANLGKLVADVTYVVVKPFKESPLHGIGFLFPLYTIYYMYTRWKQMKPAFVRLLGSCAPILLVILAYAALPEVNPKIKGNEPVKERLRGSVEEIEEEIKSDVGQVGKKIEDEERQLVKPSGHEPKSGEPSP
jgi:hypothetical protein